MERANYLQGHPAKSFGSITCRWDTGIGLSMQKAFCHVWNPCSWGHGPSIGWASVWHIFHLPSLQHRVASNSVHSHRCYPNKYLFNPNAGIKGTCHHDWLLPPILILLFEASPSKTPNCSMKNHPKGWQLSLAMSPIVSLGMWSCLRLSYFHLTDMVEYICDLSLGDRAFG